MQTITIDVADLLPGDEFWHDGKYFYTVIGQPMDDGEVTAVPVQHMDGGTDLRRFDKGTQITVRRDA